MSVFDNEVVEIQKGMLELDNQDKFGNFYLDNLLQGINGDLLEDLWEGFVYDKDEVDSEWKSTIWRKVL